MIFSRLSKNTQNLAEPQRYAELQAKYANIAYYIRKSNIIKIWSDNKIKIKKESNIFLLDIVKYTA